MKFDVRYYLIAILFILFDLETAFLFPWGVALRDIGWPGFFAMGVFLLEFLVGFVYIWKKARSIGSDVKWRSKAYSTKALSPPPLTS